MSEHFDSQLEYYLDGLLMGEKLAAFESRMANDSALQAAVKNHHAINQSLQRSLALPAHIPHIAQLNGQLHSHVNGQLNGHMNSQLNGHAPGYTHNQVHGHVDNPHDGSEAETKSETNSETSADTLTNASAPSNAVIGRIDSSTAKRPYALLRRVAIAALFASALFSAWAVWTQVLKPAAQSDLFARVSVADYFNDKVADGLTPYWKCENDAQFAAAFRDRFGQALLMKLPESGAVAAGGVGVVGRGQASVECTGLDYSPTLTSNTMAALLRINGEAVIVLIDRADAVNQSAVLAPASAAPSSSSSSSNAAIHTHRRTIGELILVEVSRCEEPRALDLFYEPVG